MYRIPAIVALTLMTGLALTSAWGARPGSTDPQITPVALDTLPGCTTVWATGLNAGEPFQVAGQAGGCADGHMQPVLWTEATGTVGLPLLEGMEGGSTEAVSDDGTSVGWLIGGGAGIAFVRPPGGPTTELPMLAGMTYAAALDISPNGAFIVGTSSTDTEFHSVRWDRSSGDWLATEVPLRAGAVSDDGTVAGSVAASGAPGERKAAVWRTDTPTELPGVDARATGIDASGTIVVGHRLADATCRRPPCGKYEVPMAWTWADGEWTAHELDALDGVDSEALAAAFVDGRPVVVGYGYTKKDAIMRAVYWTLVEGAFGPPTRLAGLDGNSRAWAHAADVNPSGRIAGTSGLSNASPRRAGGMRAVLWQLP
jgi:uncharacterized membrane protein